MSYSASKRTAEQGSDFLQKLTNKSQNSPSYRPFESEKSHSEEENGQVSACHETCNDKVQFYPWQGNYKRPCMYILKHTTFGKSERKKLKKINAVKDSRQNADRLPNEPR